LADKAVSAWQGRLKAIAGGVAAKRRAAGKSLFDKRIFHLERRRTTP
jgi:hypothetical protein